MATLLPEIPCLNLAISRLSTIGKENFAIWVLKAPYPGGYAHHDCLWPETLSQTWRAWQSMFAPDRLQQELPLVSQPLLILSADAVTTPYTSRLMQHLGVSLWQWVFRESIQNTLAQSQGIALGQDKPLRLRLDIRDPDLIVLPWEIMQPQSGKPAISIYQPILFSRTISDVDPLPARRTSQSLNILLVLGQNGSDMTNCLELEREAAILAQTLKGGEKPGSIDSNAPPKAKCLVYTLLQPTPEELILQLETGAYNIFFYAGHGLSGPDGGLLFLGPGMTLNGTELAQVLTRCQVTLCVINACWGAQPAISDFQTLPRSSLAEVLIHHGVPAVLGMRDEIADREALTFIQALAQALAARLPIDQAVAIARQQLLTVYRFNYPAWTLPVLYLHPEFDGELVPMLHEGITALPENTPSSIGKSQPTATLRALSPETQIWSLGADVVRLGRLAENDIVISEVWVSLRHAEIFYRNASRDGVPVATYFLRDTSRNGTLFLGTDGWQKVHREEVPLQPGMQLKFGSAQGQTFEFTVEG